MLYIVDNSAIGSRICLINTNHREIKWIHKTKTKWINTSKNIYEKAINYYWGASRANKRWYKRTRSFTVIIGALVTLIASLTSSKIIVDFGLKTTFELGTPILAAVLTIVAGFSQSFQWGSAWQNMVLTAQYLEKEHDRYLVTPINERNFIEEVDKLNSFVINESEGFFERMLGVAKPTVIDSQADNGD